MTCCLQGSSPTRHFDSREDPGDEVVMKYSAIRRYFFFFQWKVRESAERKKTTATLYFLLPTSSRKKRAHDRKLPMNQSINQSINQLINLLMPTRGMRLPSISESEAHG